MNPFHDFKAEIKLVLVVALLVVVLAVGSILLLREDVRNLVTHMPPPTPTPATPPPPQAAPSPQPQTPDMGDFTLSDVEGVEGWQTYRNDEFGFEVKVPPSFQDFGNGGFRDNNESGSLGISVVETQEPLQSYVDERTAPENNIFEGNVILTVRERKDIQLDGIEAVYLDTYVGNGLAAPVLHAYIDIPGNHLVDVKMIANSEKEKIAKETYDQILSTFRFTP